MPGTNGTATRVEPEPDDPLDLGDLISETRTVTITRDGQRVRLEGFVYSTAPVSVYALIAQAHDEYMAVIDDEAAKGIHRDQALCRYYSQIARALVIGLTVDEADRLGGDFKRLALMLAALGYPPPRAEAAEGEVPAAESTTDASSPGSEPSTAATTLTG
jgi:hypothetical protein